jgi:hypothetical protein
LSRRARRPRSPAQRRLALAVLGVLAAAGAELLARASEDPVDPRAPSGFALLDHRFARRGLAGLVEGPGLGAEDGVLSPSPIDGPLPTGARRVIVAGSALSRGENLPAELRWADRLQLSLAEDQLQVVNLSMDGATALLVERGLLPGVLAAEPAVVVLGCTGLHEAVRAELPDAWSLRPDSGLTNLALSSALVRRLLPVALSLPRRARGEADPPARVSVEEHRRSLRASLDALAKNNVPVIVLLDHVVAPDAPGVFALADVAAYRAGARAEAEARGLPVLDPATLLPPPHDRWFEQSLAYNADAHGEIAKALAPLVRAAAAP